MTEWTEERVELLRKLWGDGLSAAQITRHLGGVSRSAVCGKVHRLKLSGRGRKAAAQARPRTRRAKPKPEPAVSQAVPPRQAANDDVIVPISRRVKLNELNSRACKWPNGDPQHEDFSYCGNDTEASSPYCPYHARIAYQPVNVQKRK